MTITLTYQPDKGVSFGDTLLLWGTDREQTRTSLNDTCEISDSVIDFSQYHNDDTSNNIIQRRDIYKTITDKTIFSF